jgi:hypothetical protein
MFFTNSFDTDLKVMSNDKGSGPTQCCGFGSAFCEKQDTDPHQSQKADPDPHQGKNSGAMKAHGTIEGRGCSQWSRSGSVLCSDRRFSSLY